MWSRNRGPGIKCNWWGNRNIFNDVTIKYNVKFLKRNCSGPTFPMAFICTPLSNAKTGERNVLPTFRDKFVWVEIVYDRVAPLCHHQPNVSTAQIINHRNLRVLFTNHVKRSTSDCCQFDNVPHGLGRNTTRTNSLKKFRHS